MAFMTERQIEEMLVLETRVIPVDGSHGLAMQQKTYTAQVWRGLDYLVDLGYFSTEELVDLANGEGWEPPNAPFDMRFTSIVAFWSRRCDDENNDFVAYCRGQI